MHTCMLDLRFAFRMLRAHPGISLIAAISLALGIGVTSTIFSLVDGMYLRPFPVRDPAGLIWIRSQSAEGRQSGLAWLDYLELQKSVPALAEAAVQNRRGGQLDTQSEPETVLVTVVSDNYFSLLGVEAARGRLFQADLDAALSNQPALAISDSLWRRRFGADPSLIGRSISLNKRAFTVVGVLPSDFRGLDRGVRNDIWVPVSTWMAMGNRKEFEERGSGQFETVARMRTGASMDQLKSQLESLGSRFQQERPDAYRGRRLMAATEEERQRGRGPNPSVLLLSIVGLVVVIACANVAMLLLAQAEGRHREISIRLAVGADRRRLIRQMLTEAALLAFLGGTLAMLATAWLVPLLPALLPPGPDFARFDIRVDSRVIIVTLLTCLATVTLFGSAPALAALRADLMTLLKGRGFQSRHHYMVRNLLVVVQAALSVVLIASALLLARSFLNTQQLRLGFDSDRNLLIMLTVYQGARASVQATCEEIAARLQSLPGVKKAAYCRRMPLGTSGAGATREVVIPGRFVASGNEMLRIRYNQVSPDFMAATGMRLLAGRGFTAMDTASGMRVALVNQTMSRLFWPERGAVEQRIRVDNADTLIVGIAEDTVIGKIHENPEPFMIFPFAQLPVNEITFIMETAGPPALLLDAAKRELRAAKPDIAILLTNTLQQLLHDALYTDWLPAVLSLGVGLLGTILAAAGLFGVVLQGVNRRLREMGVRMALGAQSRTLVSLVLRHGLILAGSGTIAGIPAFLATARMLANLLHGVGPYDPIVVLFSVCLVLAMAVTASLYPAWKATRVDPATVLRME